MLKAFELALPLLEQLEKHGYEAYFVGGSVRDFLLNKQIEDVDIATSAMPEEIKQIFTKTVDVGIEHGTVLVLFNGQSYEITTFRSESEYENFRRPKNVQFIRSIFEDLKRRDFSMNAIAMNRKGELIDPFSGHNAINLRIIQTVGVAEERFTEDALRMMRAIRFVSQLSFTIEEDTLKYLKLNVSLLRNISVERKTKEFEKLLLGANRRNALNVLIETELYQYLPGLKFEKEALKQLSIYKSEGLNLVEMWVLLLFCLDTGFDNIVDFLKDWKLSNQKTKTIEVIYIYLKKRQQKDWSKMTIYTAGKENVSSVEKVYNIINGRTSEEGIQDLENQYNALIIKNRQELVINGQDLLSWTGRTGGPWLREMIEKVEEGVVLGYVQNEKVAIREWLSNWNLI